MLQCLVKLALIVCSLFIVWSRWTEACTCERMHRQQQFCNADFAIRARIKGSELIYGKSITRLNGTNMMNRWPVRKLYHIRINQILRNTTSLGNVGRLHKLYTSAFDSMCGVTTLKHRTKYLLTGSVRRGGELHLSLCDWHQQWSRMTSKQRKAANPLYQQQCAKCKVVTCGQSYGGHCPETAVQPNQCLWNVKQDQDSCYNLYSVCKHVSNGQCRWSSNKNWRSCALRNPVLKYSMVKKKNTRTMSNKSNNKRLVSALKVRKNRRLMSNKGNKRRILVRKVHKNTRIMPNKDNNKRPVLVHRNNNVAFKRKLRKNQIVRYRVSHSVKQTRRNRLMQRDGVAPSTEKPVHMKHINHYGRETKYKHSTFRWAELSSKFAQLKAQDKLQPSVHRVTERVTSNPHKVIKEQVNQDHRPRSHSRRTHQPIISSARLHQQRTQQRSEPRRHRQWSELRPHGGSEHRTHGWSELRPHRQSEPRPHGQSELRPYRHSEHRPHGQSELGTHGWSELRPHGRSELRPHGQSELRPHGQNLDQRRIIDYGGLIP